MKKLVLKTTIITLVSILLCLLIAFGVLAIGFPSIVANGADKIGAKKTAVYFYERQYEKTDKIDDLYVLCFSAFNAQDYKTAEEYFTTLNNKEGFESFCQDRDEERNSNILSLDVCNGALVRSTFETQGLEQALEQATLLVAKWGYAEYSPFLFLLESYGRKLNTSQLTQVKTQINAIVDGEVNGISLSLEQKEFALYDVAQVDMLLGAL